MKHLGTEVIETERLMLRPFQKEDAQAMFDNWAKDPEVTRFLTWPAYTTVETANSILADWTSQYVRKDYYNWAIVPKDLGQPIGSVSVTEQNEKAQWMEIGYCIGKPWWHQGYTSEAMAAVMDFLFDKVGVNRIQACHAVENPHSGGVMKKCGMEFEGIHRQAGWCNVGIVDMCYYARLKQDRE